MIIKLFKKAIKSLELDVHRKMSPLFLILSILSVTALLISNIVATKSIVLFGLQIKGLPLSIAASFVVFPFTYITSDIFSEVYGYAWSRKISWISFFANLFMVGFFELIIALPGIDPVFSAEFADVLGSSYGVLFASLTAYMCGDLANDLIFRRMKNKDKHNNNVGFIHRSLLSSLCGEIIDSLVFLPLLYAFIGGYGVIIQSVYQLAAIILIQGTLKTLVEVVLTPLVVFIVNKIKHYEQTLAS
ncbi:MAG: queuosine precursor transporter [Bacillota bacterium]|nr:queuosine precursor transporter [Bacillota bacterium]